MKEDKKYVFRDSSGKIGRVGSVVLVGSCRYVVEAVDIGGLWCHRINAPCINGGFLQVFFPVCCQLYVCD